MLTERWARQVTPDWACSVVKNRLGELSVLDRMPSLTEALTI
jgi:hypothetical protein